MVLHGCIKKTYQDYFFKSTWETIKQTFFLLLLLYSRWNLLIVSNIAKKKKKKLLINLQFEQIGVGHRFWSCQTCDDNVQWLSFIIECGPLWVADYYSLILFTCVVKNTAVPCALMNRQRTYSPTSSSFVLCESWCRWPLVLAAVILM